LFSEFPDCSVQKIVVKFLSDNFVFNYNNFDLSNIEKGLEDSLVNLFTNKFKPFFEMNYEIASKEKDSLKLKTLFENISGNYRFCLSLKIKSDDQLQKINAPIDKVIKAYEFALQNCIRKYYRKDFSELNQNELIAFSRQLFLVFEISKLDD